MIANARMYSVSPAAAAVWRELLQGIAERAGVPLTPWEHAAPAPLEDLWRRPDLGAVFMCGLPFSRAAPRPVLVAAPVPSPSEFADQPRYWSEFVVRRDSGIESIDAAYGKRIAFTVPGSQSGCVAALFYFMRALSENTQGDRSQGGRTRGPRQLPRSPPFSEVIAPTITPLGALSAVVQGTADVAPLDSYAFRLLQRYRPDLTSQVSIVGHTIPTPIPPLVASAAGASPEAPSAPAVAALQSAFLDSHQNAAQKALLERLLLRRFAHVEASSYDVLAERFEAASRYWGAHPLAAVVHPAFNYLVVPAHGAAAGAAGDAVEA